MKKICLIILVFVLSFSCVSSQRMMRISPFAENDNLLKLDRDRTNLFPLYYKNGDANSIFWLIDWDQQGFAFRPIFTKENSDYSFIFPLSSWNTENKDGWAVPFYWGDEEFGMFPLFYFDDDFGYFGNFWYNKNVYDASHGVFPLYGKWNGGWNFLNYIHDEEFVFLFPLYKHDKNGDFWISGIFEKDTKDKEETYKIFSGLGRFRYQDDKLENSYLFPLWYSNSDDSEKSFRTLLFGQYENFENREKDHYVFPLWYYNSSGDESTLLSPLFYNHSDSDSSVNYSWLGAWGENKKDMSSWFVSPLFGYGDSKLGNFSLLNFAGPVYVNYENKKDKFTSILFPLYTNANDENSQNYNLALLFNRHVQNDESSTLLFPLIYQKNSATVNENYSLFYLYNHYFKNSESENSAASRLFPLYSYQRNNADTDFLYDTFLTLVNLETDENSLEFSILSSLIYEYSRYGSAENPQQTSYSSLLFSKYFRRNREENDPHRYNQDFIRTLTKRWEFLFYSYEVNQLNYWPKDLFTKEEKELVQKFQTNWITLPTKVKTGEASSKNNQESPVYESLDVLLAKRDLKAQYKSLVELLAKHGLKAEAEAHSIEKGLQELLQKNLLKGESVSHHFPLLFESETKPDAKEWDILWQVAKYKEEGDRHHFSILKYLYSENGEGKNVSRDIFPFIKADSGEESGVSFLGIEAIGYLFNWKHNKKEGHHGHFLFIPW